MIDAPGYNPGDLAAWLLHTMAEILAARTGAPGLLRGCAMDRRAYGR